MGEARGGQAGMEDKQHHARVQVLLPTPLPTPMPTAPVHAEMQWGRPSGARALAVWAAVGVTHCSPVNQLPSPWVFYFDNSQCDTAMETVSELVLSRCHKSNHVCSPHTYRRTHLLFPLWRRSPHCERMMTVLE